MTAILVFTAIITLAMLLIISGFIFYFADDMWEWTKRWARQKKNYLIGRIGGRYEDLV